MRRWWWAVLGGVVLLIGVGVIAYRWQAGADCRTVRTMIEFNQQHNTDLINRSGFDSDEQSDDADYQLWADRLHDFAKDLRRPELERHARHAADLGSDAAALVPSVRREMADGTMPSDSPAMRKYAVIDGQFRDEMAALDSACPA